MSSPPSWGHVESVQLAPGPFPSKMTRKTLEQHADEFVAQTPLRRLGEPDDVAGAVIYLSSRAGSYVTGALLTLDGGLTVNR
ncbi:SDR family oxidoreductase [Pseudonocardia kujensis]|uniref:SDR family oxidoreductase n=1 Tax=Pseudonocardia kujensis TaxID=1128675 RepID=UPI001E346459|nr:SDR family oxidoreductase [Pseudonocardia kujensis]MCE0765964.1 SDR family oxidoreductase [Pseudonocardia kujensis]